MCSLDRCQEMSKVQLDDLLNQKLKQAKQEGQFKSDTLLLVQELQKELLHHQLKQVTFSSLGVTKK